MHRGIAIPAKKDQPSSLVLICLLLVLALACSQGRAQSTQGAVVGSVTDAGGAVVPNATVTLTNTDEGTTRVAKTNGVGDYRFLDAKAGNYSIQVEAQGFDKWSVAQVVAEGAPGATR